MGQQLNIHGKAWHNFTSRILGSTFLAHNVGTFCNHHVPSLFFGVDLTWVDVHFLYFFMGNCSCSKHEPFSNMSHALSLFRFHPEKQGAPGNATICQRFGYVSWEPTNRVRWFVCLIDCPEGWEYWWNYDDNDTHKWLNGCQDMSVWFVNQKCLDDARRLSQAVKVDVDIKWKVQV